MNASSKNSKNARQLTVCTMAASGVVLFAARILTASSNKTAGAGPSYGEGVEGVKEFKGVKEVATEFVRSAQQPNC